jgi:hypothetical protein
MSARRRAERFASAVDAHTPATDVPSDLRALVEVVGAMRELDAPRPRPEFAAQLREQLMVEAQTQLAPSPLSLPPRRRGARERRLTAAAAVFTLVGGAAGMAAAAQNALPGEALYPIKRGLEDARLSVQSADESRGRSYLAQASSRLDEATRLVQEDAPSIVVADTVDSFVVQAVAGADLLLASYGDTRAPDDVQDLRAFAKDALTRLQALAEDAPADVQDELTRAAIVLQRIDQQATSTCDQCSELPSLDLPALMAQAAEISRAMEAVRTQKPNNDHPPIVVTLPRPGSQGQPLAGGGSDSGEGPRSGGGGAVATADGASTVLQTPQKALKELDKASGGLVGQLSTTTKKTTEKKTTEETVDDVENGLEDVLTSPLDGVTGE